MNPKQMIESRPVHLIFRDCLKLAKRMVDDPVKVVAIRKLIYKQFQRNKQVFDQDKIHELKMNAVRVQKDHSIPKKQINILEQQQDELRHTQ